MFKKDLEEIKESQLKMNNEINEIKNTLEGTMSKDRKSEVEDKTVEINEAERKKEKPQHSNHRSPRRRRQKERP